MVSFAPWLKAARDSASTRCPFPQVTDWPDAPSSRIKIKIIGWCLAPPAATGDTDSGTVLAALVRQIKNGEVTEWPKVAPSQRSIYMRQGAYDHSVTSPLLIDSANSSNYLLLPVSPVAVKWRQAPANYFYFYAA